MVRVYWTNVLPLCAGELHGERRKPLAEVLLQVGAMPFLRGPWGILSEEERRRALRFHWVQDAVLYAAAHALVRVVLSMEFKTLPPAAWRFSTGPFGKPSIEGQAQGGFNLTHSWPYAAVAVVARGACGIDVECHEQRGEWLSVAGQAFHPCELRCLHAAPDPGRMFVRLWTLKEAVSKAVGKGLSLPFDSFAVAPEQDCVRLESEGTQVRFQCVEDVLEGAALSVALADEEAEAMRVSVTMLDLHESMQLF